ncbi:DegT/DnrJ/EryC1/StrS aminotransferase family protein [bacterium]|nr:DegT/DnrJ/EryC1/StrS aminotransferase family protein [bacterium]
MLSEIRLSKSCIGEAEKLAVNRVLDRGFFGMGQEVKDFEAALTEFFGRPAVCVVNGTAALHLGLQAAGIKQGDEVLVQSLTYVASFQAIAATGARPISCDVLASTLGIDLSDAKRKLTSRTKAIMPVHYAGGVGELDAIYDFADTHGLRVIEDAAHAFGSTYKGKKVGALGDIACFSFDGIKNITSGEGGCVVTDDPIILERVRDARLLGVERDTDKRFSGERSWDPDVHYQGWRYHMSDIMAAIGKEQLKNFDFHKNRRQELAKCYAAHMSEIPSISIFKHDYDNVVPHIFVILLGEATNRGHLIKFLGENGIPAGIHYKPNHLLSYFSSNSAETLPVTDMLYPRLLTLPLHPELDKKTVELVAGILKKGIEHVG